MLVIGREGLTRLLEQVTTNELTLHLYTRPVELRWTQRSDEFREWEGGGYAPAPLSGWTTSSAQGLTTIAAAPVQFTLHPEQGQEVVGYFLRLGDVVIGAEPLPAPFVVPSQGAVVRITPRLGMKDLRGESVTDW